MPVINVPPMMKTIIGDLDKRIRKLEQSPYQLAYGSFFDLTTQTIANTASVYPIAISNTDVSNNVSITSGSRITVARAGVYNLQFSLQLSNASASEQDAYIWLRKNGTDVADSATTLSIPKKHGSVNGAGVAAWNFIVTLGNGEYVQLYWNANSTDMSMPTIAASASPVIPRIPSVIVTMTEVTYTTS